MKTRNNLVANLIWAFANAMGGRSQYDWSMLAAMLQGQMRNGVLIGADPEEVALAALAEEERHDEVFERYWSHEDRMNFLDEVLKTIRS